MTNLLTRTFLLFASCSLFFLSCEKPGLSNNDENISGLDLANSPVSPQPLPENPEVVMVEEKSNSESESLESEPVVVNGEETKPQDATDRKDPEITVPELRVFYDADVIVAEGALKSRIQKKRIEEQMSEAFSGTRVRNDIEVDFKRHPVGWGGRVTEGFLVPYFQDITEPRVEYIDGVIILGGKGTAQQRRMFQQLAVIVFQDVHSRDITNRIEVVGNEGQGKAKGMGGRKEKTQGDNDFPEDLPLFVE